MTQRGVPAKRGFERGIEARVIRSEIETPLKRVPGPVMGPPTAVRDLTDENLENKILEFPVLYRYPGMKDCVLELLRRFNELKEASQNYSEI
jgi:hypothetical protein